MHTQFLVHLIVRIAAFAAALFAANTFAVLPDISSFTTSRSAIVAGQTAFVNWSVSGATTLALDQGIGDVTGSNSFAVAPTATTRYTLTATNASGTISSTVQVDFIALTQLSATTYHTENAFFVIADPMQVTFPDWNSIYSTANVDSYIAQLKSAFPDDHMMVVVAANQLMPANVPSVITRRHLASGIGQNSITGVGVPNICRFHLGTSPSIFTGAFAVLDHEIGHNWGVQIGMELGIGHWLKEATAHGQMAENFSDPMFTAVKQINGDPANGFTWTTLDNLARNETETFSDQDLYAIGLNPVFPDTYVLTNPVLNPDNTVSYSATTKYDHAWVLNKHGPRIPDYRTSDKQFRLGFVYVARDLAEIQGAYGPVEQSARHFANAEQVDTVRYRFQVPFLVETKFRASVKTRLADLDGNVAPTLALTGASYFTSGNGSVTIPFAVADADGPPPTVSLVPPSASATIGANSVQLSGLANGTYFYTLKAEDAFGKKAFTHFVVDVNLLPGAVNLLSVRSRKKHGVAGDQDLVFNPPASGVVTVEPRSGIHTIAFRFDGPATSAGSVTVLDGAAIPVINYSTAYVNNEIIFTLPGVSDGSRITITLSDVNGVGISASAMLDFLIGDVNYSRAVNASDISALKARSGSVVNAGSYMFDLDASGDIDATDVSMVKAKSGRVSP